MSTKTIGESIVAKLQKEPKGTRILLDEDETGNDFADVHARATSTIGGADHHINLKYVTEDHPETEVRLYSDDLDAQITSMLRADNVDEEDKDALKLFMEMPDNVELGDPIIVRLITRSVLDTGLIAAE